MSPLVSIVLVLCNRRVITVFAVNQRAPKRASTWEYTASAGSGWDDWGKDLAASNVVVGKRSRKAVDRTE